MHTFAPEAVKVLKTRVEQPETGGGWELVDDMYSKRVDFNQTGFTLHQVEDSDAAGGDTPSQPPGSQGPPVLETTTPVDVAYTNIRSIKRGMSPRECASDVCCIRAHSCRFADTSSPAYVVWTIGLHEAADVNDDVETEQLGEGALAARAKARKEMTTSDAAITLKFARVNAASLEACVVPLIFEENPVRFDQLLSHALYWLLTPPLASRTCPQSSLCRQL